MEEFIIRKISFTNDPIIQQAIRDEINRVSQMTEKNKISYVQKLYCNIDFIFKQSEQVQYYSVKKFPSSIE